MSRVVVVGAGPVGLLAAGLLARRGVACVVLEEHAGLSTQGKAGTIQTRSLEILAALGVLDEVMARAVRVDAVVVSDRRSGRVLLEMRLHELANVTAFPMLLNITQVELEPVLLDAAQRHGAHVRFGCRVIGLDQDGDGCRLALEGPRGREAIDADYVLGCDGAHSTLRELLALGMDGITFPERLMIVELEAEVDEPAAHLEYVVDPEEFVIRVRQPRFWRMLYPLPPDADATDAAEVERKVRLGFGTDHPVRILTATAYRVHHRLAERFSHGRVFLLGDAAHLITPNGGLGLNTGMEDAFNIAWKLAWVLRHGADASLLETYEAERRPVVERTARGLAVANRDYMAMRGAVRRRLRNATLAALRRSARLRWQTMYARSLLGVTYRPAESVGHLARLRPAIAPPLLVGDRAYDGTVFAPDGRRVCLFELLGDDFVALSFADARRAQGGGDDEPGLRTFLVSPSDAPASSPARARTLVDPGGALALRFGAAEGALVLVRPDHHICAVEPAHGAGARALYERHARRTRRRAGDRWAAEIPA